jgi:serine protease AprX
MSTYSLKTLQQLTALFLVILLVSGPALAGLTVTGADGITVSGADGITYIGTSGITASGADGFLAFGPNGITASGADGITASGADGITASGADGITASGADGVTYLGANGITASGADGITISGADGITASGADGITVSGADGKSYRVDSVTIKNPTGITASGADTFRAIGVDGITASGADGITASGADGIMISGADGITVSGADGITASGADGQLVNISPNGITISGADVISASGADSLNVSGADEIRIPGTNGIMATSADARRQSGLQSLDPELALILDDPTDDRNINAVIVYHRQPAETDIAELQRIGVLGGTRYRALPMISVTAKRTHIIEISRLATVRSIYGNRTLQSTMNAERAVTGVDRMRRDGDLIKQNAGLPISGRGVTVAVLDTGVDGTHNDLSGRVVQNVKLVDTQSASVGFTNPVNVENVSNTDQIYGHGTFVAGVIAGNGVRSGGKYSGVAPGARVLGLSAGDLTLSFVLAGFDYLLTQGAATNARVVNCSFSANSLFDSNDPVNVATRMLVDRGINVVFSAGNTGDGLHTLNPYAVAPWVISVGATDERGRLMDWSSRGEFGSALFKPTLVAPGASLVSLRPSTVASVTSATGLTLGADRSKLAPAELAYYTTASGTSFSAPQVAGTIALMLEANPRLTPSEVRDLLQRTATPLPNYYQHEVGAGMLNAHAAVLEAAFPQRQMGLWRATLDRGQVRFVNDELQTFEGSVQPGKSYETNINIPADTVLASMQVAWGPYLSANDLGLTLYDSSGTKLDESNRDSQPGLTGKRERVMVRMPNAGSVRAQVVNKLGVAGNLQPLAGTLEVTRVQYAPLADLNHLSATAREDIRQALRTFVMTPYGNNFRPERAVTRSELASTLVLGGRVPQYLPGHPRFTDVTDLSTLIFVESAQSAPGGALFYDAPQGSPFRPDDQVDRLTAAIALVRALGLDAEAKAKANTAILSGGQVLADNALIPGALRGYVQIALDRGLLQASVASFHPQQALTRVELARSMAVMSRLAME